MSKKRNLSQEEANQLAMRDELRDALIATGDKPKLVEYLVREAAYIVRLTDGTLATIPRRHIQKDFWFGESGYDYDEVTQTADRASKSEQFFIERNLAEFNGWLERLDDADTWVFWKYKRCNGVTGYYWERRSIRGDRLSQYPEEKILSDEDRVILRNGFLIAKEDFTKHLHAYIKRYGLKHINCSTYWMDA